MKTALKWIGLALLTLILLLLAWGLIEPYFMDVEEELAPIPGLPAAWEGQRVAQISDFQVGMWLDNEPTVRRIVEAIVERSPALVLITGDFIYHPLEGTDEEIRNAVELVRPLTQAGLPTYAVLGNHDYAMNTQQDEVREDRARVLEEALEGIGVQVLQNEAVPLKPPVGAAAAQETTAGPLYLVGIGSSWAGKARPEVAVGRVPEGAPRLVMMHNPNAFGGIPPSEAPLAMAGHTHGGQVRLPLTPQWSWLGFVEEDSVHADGWIPNYGAAGNRLYVNRGIGFGGAPIRINCTPELTLFTLRSSEPAPNS